MVATNPSTPQLRDPFWPGPLSLPQALTDALRLTPEQFALLCRANPDAVMELAADGSLISMTPTGSETGGRNGALLVELGLALRNGRLAYKLFDSSTGFRLRDGSIRSPDASLVALERWRALTVEERQGFAPLCPDLVVELASSSHDGPRGLAALRQKMDLYQANGARLGWLLIPAERAVEVWKADDAAVQPLRLEAATRLDGGETLAGLAIELEEIWAG
ncbi:MAG: Uma2 family endonuclease [Cyanobium sp.]|jgi:Uma2 family endonuclease